MLQTLGLPPRARWANTSVHRPIRRPRRPAAATSLDPKCPYSALYIVATLPKIKTLAAWNAVKDIYIAAWQRLLPAGACPTRQALAWAAWVLPCSLQRRIMQVLAGAAHAQLRCALPWLPGRAHTACAHGPPSCTSPPGQPICSSPTANKPKHATTPYAGSVVIPASIQPDDGALSVVRHACSLAAPCLQCVP